MKTTTFSSVLIFSLLVFLSTFTYGQDTSLNTYQRAVEALNKQDCFSAVIELEKYKIEARSLLITHPDFLTSIEKQITECKLKLGQLQPNNLTFGGTGGGIVINGIVRPDETRLKNIETSRSVRFGGF